MGEVVIAEAGRPIVPRDVILLAVSRQGDFAIADDFAELVPGDRALVIVPLAPFKEGKDTLAAAAERFPARRIGYAASSHQIGVWSEARSLARGFLSMSHAAILSAACGDSSK